MPSKCPKCHLEGERVSDRAVYDLMPPGPGGLRLQSVEVHIIDGPKCLTRQLAAANERAERAVENHHACQAQLMTMLVEQQIELDHIRSGCFAAHKAAEAAKEKP